MDALFLIPCMTSTSVNEKLIPALAKLIERNVLITNSALFKKAAMIKYTPRFNALPFSKVQKESECPVIFLNQVNINEDYLNSMEKEILKDLVLEAPRGRGRSGPPSEEDWNEADQVHPGEDNIKREPHPQSGEPVSSPIDRNEETRRSGGRNERTNASSASTRQRFENNRERNNRNDRTGESSGEREDKAAKAKTEHLKNLSTIHKNKLEIEKMKGEKAALKDRIKHTRGARSGEADLQTKHTFVSRDQIEIPSGIQFFNSISLEPTIMEIPITFNLSRDPEVGSQTVMVRIGVKCIPYIVNDVSSIKKVLKEARTMNSIERFFKQAIRKLDLVKSWFAPWDEKAAAKSAINRGNLINPDEAKNMILYSPNMTELESPDKLAKMFNMSKASPWSTMIMLSSFDLKDEELKEIIKNYKKMTNYSIGDLIITNETKESAYFCTARYGSCQEISFEYLKKILNLDNIIDSSLVSRMSRPFSKAAGKPISSAVNENTAKLDRIKDIIS